MIRIGTDMIRFRERCTEPQTWSRYAWLLNYLDRKVLFHSLNSETITCTEDFLRRAASGDLTSDERLLLGEKGFLAAEEEDTALVCRVQAAIERTPKPTTLFLIVTDICNLRCTYCYQNLPSFSKREVMPWETIQRSVDEFLRVAGDDPKIFFYGGEPLLREEDIRRTAVYLRETLGRHDISIDIMTNGTVYKPDFIDFMKSYSIGLGISIDGDRDVMEHSRPSVNPTFDAFGQICAFFAACKKVGIDCAALCTITEHNVQKIQETARFLVEELGTKRLTFNLQLRRYGDAIKIDEPYWHEIANRISETYLALLKQDVLEGRTLRYLTGLTQGTYTVSECDAGYGIQIVVRPDGAVGPCQGYLYNDTSGFFVKKKDWTGITSTEPWQRFIEATPINIPSCHRCPFVGTCGGGCCYDRTAPTVPNPNFCQYARTLLFRIIHALAEST